MGRDQQYPEEFHDNNVETNATEFLQKLNAYLAEFAITPKVRSGWRPRKINQKVGGSPNSYHIFGRACDLVDLNGELKKTFLLRPEKLLKYELWMEDPKYTPTWCHLDNGIRTDREIRVFVP